MSLRLVAANLLKKFRFPSCNASSTSVVTSNALPISLPGKSITCHWHRTGAYGWRTGSRGPCLWMVIYGHLDASTEAVFESDTEKDDVTELKKIEDGSVVSNIHTSKWRVFTAKGRGFFLQLQSLSTLASLELAKQELLETREEHTNLEARKALVQCVSAYREYVSKKSVADSPEIKNEYLSCVSALKNCLVVNLMRSQPIKGIPGAELRAS